MKGDDKEGPREGAVGESEFELDAEGAEDDLEEAMRQALEAVEGEGDGDGDPPAVSHGGDGRPTGQVDVISNIAAKELQNELAELRERSVRTLADFDNYRKRVERERGENRRYSGFEVIREFLPIIDNLERALEADGSVEDLSKGIELILRQMSDLLRRHGVERVAAVGEAFDPAVHDAVSKTEDDSVEVATVSEELQAGYKMHDRLVRAASVLVVLPGAGRSGSGGTKESG